MRLFHGAKVVLGVHGAAFSNIMFCKPNRTSIVEITFFDGYEFPVGKSTNLSPFFSTNLDSPFLAGFRDYAHLAHAFELLYRPFPLANLSYSGSGYVPVDSIVAHVASLLA